VKCPKSDGQQGV